MSNNHILFHLEINKLALGDLVDDSIHSIVNNKQSAFACANAHSLFVAKKDKVFKDALLDTEYLVADGSGVSVAGYILNMNFGPRITGYDYFYALLSKLNNGLSGKKARIFFFGSTQNTLDAIKENLPAFFPNLELCGTYSPPFGQWSDEEQAQIINIINSAKPDVLWVGMTAPKQEKWVYHNREKLNVCLIGSIGAVFDFFAGTLDRAPAWIRKLGLEWLYRFIKEPKRTWKRHLISEPGFILGVFFERFKRVKDNRNTNEY